jgi:hypothetical protein
MEMHCVLMRPHIPQNDPDLPIAEEADRDMQILAFVFDQLVEQQNERGFRAKVKLLLKDRALPQDDSDSIGRDTQVELFVAAICKSAGLTPVAFEEPDVTCTFNGIKFGIAAKRLKSINSMRSRLKGATKQIKRSQLPGIVAVDASVALNPKNEALVVPDPQNFGRDHYNPFWQQYTHYHFDDLRKWISGGDVRGILFQDHHLIKDWGLASMTFQFPGSHHESEFFAFANAYAKGLPNLTGLS